MQAPVEAEGLGKTTKCSEVRSKTHFFDLAKAAFQLDPSSAEGVNTHVAGLFLPRGRMGSLASTPTWSMRARDEQSGESPLGLLAVL